MTLLLSLFFISLLSITIMFGRKLALVRNKEIMIMEQENIILEIPFVGEIKQLTVKKIKRYGYVSLVTTIRMYFRSKNLAKVKYEDLKTKLRKLHSSKAPEGTTEKEVSRFLKVVSDYKHKIRRIKTQIEEEEEIK